MEFSTLNYEVSERIATITIARPDKLNQYNPVMSAEINEALKAADTDDDVRVVIFTGGPVDRKGELKENSIYCAGFELVPQPGHNVFEFDEDEYECRDTGGTNAISLFNMKKPVIAAINGSAVGVGITMTLPMDIRILSSKAKVAFPFVQRGFVSETCLSWFLPRIVGISKANEWVLTGRYIMPDEALAAGLVSEVVEPDQVYPRAREIARQIVENTAPVAVAICRQLIYQMAGERHPMTAHKIESTAYKYIGASHDANEGPKAFLEKRKPEFNMSVNTDMPRQFPWFPQPEFPRNIEHL